MNTTELTALIKADVLLGIADHLIPPTVRTFSELHKYCDANMLGIVDTLDLEGSEWEVFCDTLNDAQNTVNVWLQAGRPA